MSSSTLTNKFFSQYADRLIDVLTTSDWSGVNSLALDLHSVWKSGQQVFFCGNGGSAGNAIHLANDFIYGVAKKTGGGLKAISLSSNPAIITCLANDVGYDLIYSEQLAVLGGNGDLIVVLSGSGNSSNIINALVQAKNMGVKSHAILGYDGGKALSLADNAIHFPINDMQIAEDMQLIVGHMLMQYLHENK